MCFQVAYNCFVPCIYITIDRYIYMTICTHSHTQTRARRSCTDTYYMQVVYTPLGYRNIGHSLSNVTQLAFSELLYIAASFFCAIL